jgi:Cu2+-exporting ATPase
MMDSHSQTENHNSHHRLENEITPSSEDVDPQPGDLDHDIEYLAHQHDAANEAHSEHGGDVAKLEHKNHQPHTVPSGPEGHEGHVSHIGHAALADHNGQEAHTNHTGHEQLFRQRFWVSLVLSVPVLLFSPTIQGLLNFTLPSFTGSQWIAPVFAVTVFLYGGLPFLRMAVPELQKRQPGMHDDPDLTCDKRSVRLQPGGIVPP